MSLEADLYVPDLIQNLFLPPSTPADDQVNSSVGSAETLPGGTPSPDLVTADGVGAHLSGDGSDPEQKVSEFGSLGIDAVVTESRSTAQTGAPGYADDQAISSVGHTEPDPGNTPSPVSSSQAAVDGISSNRDASPSEGLLPSTFKGLLNRCLQIFAPTHTADQLIDIVARGYDLERLKTGITVDDFDNRIDKWKKIEEHIVRQELPSITASDLDDYGPEWQVFYALQSWYWHRYYEPPIESSGQIHGSFPPGYRTLYDQSIKNILERSDWKSALSFRGRGRKSPPDADER